MNPVPVMALVEVIRALQTGDAAFAATMQLCISYPSGSLACWAPRRRACSVATLARRWRTTWLLMAAGRRLNAGEPTFLSARSNSIAPNSFLPDTGPLRCLSAVCFRSYEPSSRFPRGSRGCR